MERVRFFNVYLHHRIIRPIFYRRIIDTFYKGCMSILDAGCGRGEFLLAANSKGKVTIGIDLDANALQRCRNSKLPLIICDLSYLPFKPGSLDAVFFSHVIEHLLNPEVVLSEFFRVIRTDGRLVIITPTEEPDFWKEPSHIKAYTKEELRVVLQKAGFRVLKVCYDKMFMLKMGDSELLKKLLNKISLGWARMNIIAQAEKYARAHAHA